MSGAGTSDIGAGNGAQEAERELSPVAAFSPEERAAVYRAIYERRDVRNEFLDVDVPQEVLRRIIDAAHHAPSVGLMQPWNFIVIRDRGKRAAVHAAFERAATAEEEILPADRRAQ